MAKINESLIAQTNKPAAPVKSPLALMLDRVEIQERFKTMLGEKSGAFLSSLLTLTNQTKALQKCEPRTILSAASIAASLDLPVNPSLGFCWIIGYGSTATFQMGFKGLIQLAQRSGLMKSIIVTEVYEGELKKWNKFTEEVELGEKISDKVIGYYASFTLTNGFKKATYWTQEDVLKHAKRFSKAFNSGPWQTDTIAMCKKTVLSNLLRTYAPLSIEMQQAVEADEKVATMNENGETEFTDVDVEAAEVIEEDGKVVDVETGEVLFNG